MFAHRRPKRRFQLDAPQAPRHTAAHSPMLGLLPVTVAVRQRRNKRRFRVGQADTSLWSALPFRAPFERIQLLRRMVMTLAQRRQLRRLGLIVGVVCALVAVLMGSLLAIPSTRAALFPQFRASRLAAPDGSQAGTGPFGASSRALHIGASLPFTALQAHTSASGAPAPSIQATAAFVFDPERGVILYQKNADATYPAASLTKVMTLLVTVDATQPDQLVTIGPDAAALVNSNNSYMGVSEGEQLTIRDLLYGLILVGGNDAALALADAVGGDEASFVAMMNERAFQLGLSHTHFVSPDGAASGDVTSAGDMAKLSALTLLRPGVEQVTSASQVVIPQTSAHKAFSLQSGNELLAGGSAPYAGANGVKTGYTADAGYCMAFSAQAHGRLVVGVVLGDPSEQSRSADAHALLDWAFAQDATGG